MLTNSIPVGPVWDLKKWTEAMRNIYVKEHLGASRQIATKEVLKDWNEVEQKNFINWLKYYESGDQYKYKTAQYYVNDNLGYFLPNPGVKKSEPSTSGIPSPNQMAGQAEQIVQQNKPELSADDRRKIIEDQRRKLISRLNSVEKLLGSHQGHLFAGTEFEKLLQSIYDLKKQIQTINKVSISSQIYTDLIVRQANILKKGGYNTASDFMVKLAQQVPGQFDMQQGTSAVGGSVPQGLGNADTPTPIDALSPPPASLDDDKEEPKKGIDGFLDNLESGGFTDGDELDADDNSAKDEIIFDDNDVLLDREVGDVNDLVVEAQMMPPDIDPEMGDIKPIKTPPPVEKNKDIVGPEGEKANTPKDKEDTSNFDAILDAAFDKVNINELVSKLQNINSIFKKREISRQLSIVSLMLSKLNLIQFFPELSEIEQKTLDATNYSLTRMESIISNLQGVNTSSIDIDPERATNNPDALRLQQVLQNQENKEKERKQLKKDVENKQLQEKAKPELEVESPGNELGAENPVIEPTAPAPKPVPKAPVAPLGV